MRCVLIADVHANREALTVVLAEADRRGYDALICAGDLVGYGPDPNACARELMRREACCVAGNHDLMALGRMPLTRCVPDGQRAIRWTRRWLEPDVRLYLDELPLVQRVFPGIAVCHGSLDDPDEYVSTPRAARRQLQRLRERHATFTVLVCGHTHRPALHSEAPPPLPGASWVTTTVRRLTPLPAGAAGGRIALAERLPCLINPGAVGQSRDDRPLARFAYYDTDRQEVEFLALSYDHPACQRRIFAAGLTTRLYVAPPPPPHPRAPPARPPAPGVRARARS